MKPVFGVFLELTALMILFAVVLRVVIPLPFTIVFILVAQALATVLIHCPAHYLVGRFLGISFRTIKLGPSTLSRVLPPSMRRVGHILVVPSLYVDARSKRTAAPDRLRAMYMAGIVGSVGAGIMFALLVSLTGSFLASLLTWLFALGYLVSDLILSPRSGDLLRAKAAMAPERGPASRHV
ncbi:MAG: hypothetical protein LYZ70_06640 [Nitrososphaerales archaeon]|nr:hypothetical protein [Nitrososphaerales archaeon]